VVLTGQVKTKAGAVVTVNVAEHVFGPSHELVTVNVTVAVPPPAAGATVLLYDNTPQQPQVKVELASQVDELKLICARV